MHIGTGLFEGKVISEPEDCSGRSCRALTIKEEIFTVIGSRVFEAKVLDINDINGMYGIEAMSRGAVIARFVNPEKAETKATEENLKIVGIDPKTLTFRQTIGKFLNSPTVEEVSKEQYDVIFFEVKSKDDFDFVNEVFQKQKNDGVTVIIYANLIGFELPEIEGGEIVETREFEDRKVAMVIKKALK
jgi:16S rRNA G966 N2-methylase RsmD